MTKRKQLTVVLQVEEDGSISAWVGSSCEAQGITPADVMVNLVPAVSEFWKENCPEREA